MKRFLWLFLFLSVGLNLGLGWRLISQSRQSGPWSRSERSWHSSGSGGRFEAGRNREGRGSMRPALSDTAAWRELMQQRLLRLAEQLDLDRDQRESFLASQAEIAPVFDQLRGQVAEAQRNLYDLVGADELDLAAVRAAAAEASACRASLDSLVTETLMKEMKILEPQQRQRFLKILPWDRVERRAGHPAGGNGPRRGGHRRGQPRE